jgi:hypothetical protein
LSEEPEEGSAECASQEGRHEHRPFAAPGGRM